MTERVSWDRYSGEDIESVVAMMLNREHPDSVRITASQGDGGVDILDRGSGPGGGDVVYQVKRFTGPLTSNHKTKIKESLNTLWSELHRDDGRWSHLNMTSWQLFTASSPTPEGHRWFAETLMTEVDVQHSAWHGLEALDGLAAKYGDVVDYYLRDGRERALSMFKQVLSFAELEGMTGEITPALVMHRVGDSVELLNKTDPHFQYTIRTGPGEPDPPTARARYVYTEYVMKPDASVWLAVDVQARCSHSLIERPITGKGRLDVREGTAFAEVFREHVEYGTGFTSPPGAFTGSIDAPGGLGGEIKNAQVTLVPIADGQAEGAEIRLEVLTPREEILGTAIVRRGSPTVGTRGQHVVLTEIRGVFAMKTLTDFDGKMTMRFEFVDPTGKSVTAIRPAYEFLSSLTDANALRFSLRESPGRLGPIQPLPPGAGFSEATRGWLAGMMSVLNVLCTIQQHTATAVKLPSEDSIVENLLGWKATALILEGKTVYGTLADDHRFFVQLERGVALPDGPFEVPAPLRVAIGDIELDFGMMIASFGEHTAAGEPVEVGESIAHPITTTDQRVTWRLPSAEDS